jgi:hypothetical protein
LIVRTSVVATGVVAFVERSESGSCVEHAQSSEIRMTTRATAVRMVATLRAVGHAFETLRAD